LANCTTARSNRWCIIIGKDILAVCSQSSTVLQPKPTKQFAETISGLIQRVTFFNEQSGFTVLKVKAKGHRDPVTVIGDESSDPSLTRSTALRAKAAPQSVIDLENDPWYFFD
jgi:hypothetical protein